MALLVALPFSSMAQKFGVVDLESIFTSMPESAAMQTQLQETTTKYEEEFGKLQTTLKNAIAEYEKAEKDASTPQSIKDRRVQDIQEIQQKMEEFRNTASQDLQRQQEQLMAPIQQKLMDAIKGVGADGSYTMIFENVAPLYTGSDVEDITAKVKTRLGIK